MAAAAAVPPPNASHALCDFSFDSVATPDDTMVEHLSSMAAALRAPEKLKRTPEQIAAYFELCRKEMPPNAFHNWTHVFDVTQFCFSILCSTGLDQVLSDAQVMGLFFAAIAHDLGHRGKSNAYEINEKSELAAKYPGPCPLEMHHTATCLAAMDSSELLSGLSQEDADLIQSVVVDCIMATDMGQHGAIMGACKVLFAAQDFEAASFFTVAASDTSETGARMLLKLLIKGSDISNPARPRPVADKWNALCYEEFYAEGDVDREKRRDLNPLHDRQANQISKSTVGFIGFVVAPIFREILKFVTAAQPSMPGLQPAPIERVLAGLESNKTGHAAEAAAAAASAPQPQPQPQ